MCSGALPRRELVGVLEGDRDAASSEASAVGRVCATPTWRLDSNPTSKPAAVVLEPSEHLPARSSASEIEWLPGARRLIALPTSSARLGSPVFVTSRLARDAIPYEGQRHPPAAVLERHAASVPSLRAAQRALSVPQHTRAIRGEVLQPNVTLEARRTISHSRAVLILALNSD